VNTTLPIAAPGEAGRPLATARGARLGIDHRVQHLVELRRVHPQHRVARGQRALGDQVDRDLDHRAAGALAGAGLQHEQLPALDRELEILHVVEVVLEQLGHPDQLAVGRRQLGRERRDGLGRADPGDDIFALRVGQKLAVQLVLAGRWVAGERHAGRAVIAEVAEHHGLDVDRGAHRRRDPVELAVVVGARVVP
jgi:hypothetical protein